jgi:hypothetical protein
LVDDVISLSQLFPIIDKRGCSRIAR